MLNQPSKGAPKNPPEPGTRLRYTSISDLRLLGKAYRRGWVEGVAQERQEEWLADLVEALKDDTKREAALRTVVAVLQVNDRRRTVPIEVLMEQIKQLRGRPPNKDRPRPSRRRR